VKDCGRGREHGGRLRRRGEHGETSEEEGTMFTDCRIGGTLGEILWKRTGAGWKV
jgi:hypothetical protein